MHKRIQERRNQEERFQEVKRRQDVALEEHGWFAHFVFDHDGNMGGMANCHTHGVWENFGHRDLQIVLPIQPEVAHGLFTTVVEQVKKGRIFKTDTAEDKVINNLDVHFREYEDQGRKLLRIILPDPTGKFPWEVGCENPYNRQTENIPS